MHIFMGIKYAINFIIYLYPIMSKLEKKITNSSALGMLNQALEKNEIHQILFNYMVHEPQKTLIILI